MKFADFEIFNTAQSLNSVKCAFRHLDRADKVGFNAESFFAIGLHDNVF